jgi:hypothetical protein
MLRRKTRHQPRQSRFLINLKKAKHAVFKIPPTLLARERGSNNDVLCCNARVRFGPKLRFAHRNRMSDVEVIAAAPTSDRQGGD